VEYIQTEDWHRLYLKAALKLGLKLIVLCAAWLIFFYLIIVGWDLQPNQELPPNKKPPFSLPLNS
jgi:hypothetical protein